MEVELIHQKKWTSVKIAYLLCRYYPMIYFPVLSWAYVGNHDPRLCPHVVVPLQILQAPLQIIPHAVMMMRAYAFTGRNRKILIGLSLLYIALIAVNLRVFITENTLPSEGFYDILGPMGCFPNYGIPSMAARMGYVMIAAVVTDGVSLAVILVHCYRTRSLGSSLGKFFVCQGVYAFLSALMVNTTAAVLFFRPGKGHIGIGVPLFLVAPDFIACRLILQLRRKVSLTDSEISRRNSQIVHDALATRHSAHSDPWLLEEEPSEPESPA